MESFDAWPEKHQKGPPPPFLPLSGEATDWLASLEILRQFCRDFIDSRLVALRLLRTLQHNGDECDCAEDGPGDEGVGRSPAIP